MIEINLLPPERRPVERTPFPRLVTIFVGVAVVSAEIFFSLILFLYTIPQKTRERDTMKAALQTKQEEAKRADELEKQITKIDERRKVIEGLYAQRQEWTPVFDHLDEPEVIPDEVWLTGFDITPASDNKAGTGKITGLARGKSPETMVGNFIKNMQADERIGKAFSKIEFNEIKVVGLATRSGTERPGAAAASATGQNVIPAMASQFTISLEVMPIKVVEEKTSGPGKKVPKPAAKK